MTPLTDEQVDAIADAALGAAGFATGYSNRADRVLVRAGLREAARIADDGLEGTTGLARMCVERVRNNIRRAAGDQ